MKAGAVPVPVGWVRMSGKPSPLMSTKSILANG